MRILVTNDDGVHADGLFALQEALSALGEVTVVAPERQQSATGHAITLHKPLRLSPTRLRDGSAAFASNGTPSDCATLGILEAMGGECDLVVSGINHGPNLGWDVHYSGTVSAAIEARVIGGTVVRHLGRLVGAGDLLGHGGAVRGPAGAVAAVAPAAALHDPERQRAERPRIRGQRAWP